jgi:5'-3' exonuclease
MRDISQGLRVYIEDRVAHHPLWAGLTVHYSGHEVPGEGEHKVIAYLRELRASPSYIANERYCINGQDADMIMLAMATHEPHFCVRYIV